MRDAFRITLTGHLTRTSLDAALRALEPELAIATRPLIADFRGITGYDADARALFIEWNTRYRAQLSSVAVVTANSFWPVVVSAMALASRQRMRVFQDESSALAWAYSGRTQESAE